VSFHRRTHEVHGAVGVLRGRRDQSVLGENFEVMEDGPIVEPEMLGELVRIPRPLAEGGNDPGTIWSSPGTREEKPNESLHTERQRRFRL